MNLATALVFLAAIATSPATDIYLPSLPDMALYFAVSEEAMRGTITIFLFGSLVSALPLGLLADGFGRRIMLSLSLAIFTVGSFLCAIAHWLPLFMTGRFLQGAGAVAIPVIGFVIIHDIHKENNAAKVMAWLGALFSVTPLLAPSLGGFLDVTIGWQSSFVLLACVGAVSAILCALKLPETKIIGSINNLSFNTIFHNYKEVLKNRAFLLYVFIFSAICCGEWCYLTLAPFHFERVLGLTADECGVYISGIGASYLLSTFLSPWIIDRFGAHKAIIVGIIFGLAGSLILMALFFIYPKSPLLVALGLTIYMMGTAIIWGPAATKSLQSFDHQRGIASSIRSLILTGSFAAGSFAGTLLDYRSILPLALFLFLCSSLSLIFFKKLDR